MIVKQTNEDREAFAAALDGVPLTLKGELLCFKKIEVKGEWYADEEDGMWYVFHIETGRPCASYTNRADAEHEADIMNHNI